MFSPFFDTILSRSHGLLRFGLGLVLGLGDSFPLGQSTCSLTLFRMDFFGAAHGWRGAKGSPLPKICRTYPTMMKLGTVIPYLKKFQKLYESPDTPFGFY